MKTNTHSKLFDEFISQWSTQFKDVVHIVDVINTYPQLLKKLDFKDLLTSDELLKSQMDWVRICSEYKGMEKDFFKPYWIPIQKSSIDYFIDLSNPKYPVFKYGFVFFEPYSYKKMNLFNSIEELLLLGDSDTNIEGISEDFKERWMEFYFNKIDNKKKK